MKKKYQSLKFKMMQMKMKINMVKWMWRMQKMTKNN